MSKNSKVTEDSTIKVEYLVNETVYSLLNRISISVDDIGEIFVNHTVRDLDYIIERDNSRIAIFPLGMHLLCGGQHLKGHGYITKQRINTSSL